jgi:endonuclease III
MTRLETLLDALQKFYGALPSPPRDPFGLFVWEVLSVHSTPRKRDVAFGALRRIPALTPDAMSHAPQKKLEESVAFAGPYVEQRLRAIRTGVDRFRRSPNLPHLIRGPLTTARRSLKGLPQMGEGGAHRMLLFAADHPVLPVDAAVSRVAGRLGYGGQHADVTKTARSVRKAVAGELHGGTEAFRRAFLYLSNHGSATCTEHDPHCTVCPLIAECPYGQKRLPVS